MVAEVAPNLVVVLVSAVISFIIGMLWYSPVLFGNVWIKLEKRSTKDMKQAKASGMTWRLVCAFIGAFITAYVAAHFVAYVAAVTFMQGMQLGFWLWLGFAAPLQFGIVLWNNKPVKLFFINTLQVLVNLMIVNGILAVWK